MVTCCLCKWTVLPLLHHKELPGRERMKEQNQLLGARQRHKWEKKNGTSPTESKACWQGMRGAPWAEHSQGQSIPWRCPINQWTPLTGAHRWEGEGKKTGLNLHGVSTIKFPLPASVYAHAWGKLVMMCAWGPGEERLRIQGQDMGQTRHWSITAQCSAGLLNFFKLKT